MSDSGNFFEHTTFWVDGIEWYGMSGILNPLWPGMFVELPTGTFEVVSAVWDLDRGRREKQLNVRIKKA